MKSVEERLAWIEREVLHHRQLFNIWSGLTKKLKQDAEESVTRANRLALNQKENK